jgi:formate dehydrogenase assembly factor FdhD
MSLTVEAERIDAKTVIITLSGRMTLGMTLREVESKINTIAAGRHTSAPKGALPEFASIPGL